MSKITIDDISRDTGLSRGTVSRALNDRPDISPKTRQRVLDSCTRLNYVPSHAARSLATGRCYSLTVAVDDLDDPLSAAILRGAIQAAGPRGYVVPVVELGFDPAQRKSRIHQMSAERIDGVILVGRDVASVPSELRAAIGARPLVCCCDAAAERVDRVEPDWVEAAKIAGRLALERGSKRVAVVSRGGSAGPRAALLASVVGSEGVRSIVLGAGSDLAPPAGLNATGEICIVSEDVSIDELLLAYCASGVRLPDAGVIVLGMPRRGFSPRQWTFVDPDGEEIGRIAAGFLLERAAGQTEIPPRTVRVAPRVHQ